MKIDVTLHLNDKESDQLSGALLDKICATVGSLTINSSVLQKGVDKVLREEINYFFDSLSLTDSDSEVIEELQKAFIAKFADAVKQAFQI